MSSGGSGQLQVGRDLCKAEIYFLMKSVRNLIFFFCLTWMKKKVAARSSKVSLGMVSLQAGKRIARFVDAETIVAQSEPR